MDRCGIEKASNAENRALPSRALFLTLGDRPLSSIPRMKRIPIVPKTYVEIVREVARIWDFSFILKILLASRCFSFHRVWILSLLWISYFTSQRTILIDTPLPTKPSLQTQTIPRNLSITIIQQRFFWNKNVRSKQRATKNQSLYSKTPKQKCSSNSPRISLWREGAPQRSLPPHRGTPFKLLQARICGNCHRARARTPRRTMAAVARAKSFPSTLTMTITAQAPVSASRLHSHTRLHCDRTIKPHPSGMVPAVLAEAATACRKNDAFWEMPQIHFAVETPTTPTQDPSKEATSTEYHGWIVWTKIGIGSTICDWFIRSAPIHFNPIDGNAKRLGTKMNPLDRHVVFSFWVNPPVCICETPQLYGYSCHYILKDNCAILLHQL